MAGKTKPGNSGEAEKESDITKDKTPAKDASPGEKDGAVTGKTGKAAEKSSGEAVKSRKTAGKSGGEAEKPGEPEEKINGAEDQTDDTGADPIAAIREELTAERDKHLRLAAEYDNYRKRSVKERELIYGDARADAITRLLPVYDNLERALNTECADEAFYRGIEMTMTQLTEIMEGLGVTQIPAAGEAFDPNRHNAVMSIEDPELGEKIIAEEFQKGFMLGDKVIRFSTVVVAN